MSPKAERTTVNSQLTSSDFLLSSSGDAPVSTNSKTAVNSNPGFTTKYSTPVLRLVSVSQSPIESTTASETTSINETGTAESQSTQLEPSIPVLSDRSLSESISSGSISQSLTMSKTLVSDTAAFATTLSLLLSSEATSPTVLEISHSSSTSSMTSTSKSVLSEMFLSQYSPSCTTDSTHIELSQSMSSQLDASSNPSVSVMISPTVSSTISFQRSDVSPLSIPVSDMTYALTSVSPSMVVFTTKPTSIMKTPEITTTTVEVSSTTTSIPTFYNKILDDRPIDLQFSISVKENFTDELQNVTSYKRFEKGLKVFYRSTPGFVSVAVIGLRKGSVIVDHEVRIRNALSMKAAVKHIRESILVKIDKTNNEIKEFEINTVQTKKLLKSNLSMIGDTGEQTLCRSFSDVCRFGYECTFVTSNEKVKASCESKCSQRSSFCGKHGECYIDHRNEALKCRCEEAEHYIYIGERCREKMELVKLKQDYIIAIASGSGGLIIIALVVVIIYLSRKQQKPNYHDSELREDHEINNRSVVKEDYPQLDRLNDSHSSPPEFSYNRGKQRTENQYQSSLLDTRYFDGREHKVLRNDRGEEAYLYQPSGWKDSTRFSSRSPPSPDTSLPPLNKSVYDYIDTSSKFELRRPNIRTGRHY